MVGATGRIWTPPMPLTDVAIRNAKPRDKPYKLGDTLGLFLLVQPSGGKLWRLKYRIDGREKKLGLGTYPAVGLGDARRRRDEARELIAAGKDPSSRPAVDTECDVAGRASQDHRSDRICVPVSTDGGTTHEREHH